MTDQHAILKENLAAYALGSLEPGEAAELVIHLQICDTCPAELAAYQRISAGLLSALPPHAPPASLKRALKNHLASSVKSVRPRFAWSWNQLAIGAALVLLVGINIVYIWQVISLKQQQAEFAGQYNSNQTAISMLAYPSTQSIAFEQNGVSGSLLVDKKRNLLAVFAWHLPPPPVGHTYQVWLIDPQGEHTSAGFLIPDADEPFMMKVIQSPQPLAGFLSLGVTIEPLGGSPKPTGANVLRVNF